MTGDQWFQFWLAISQVAVGAVVTVAAVFIAARLALGHERQRGRESRAREATERLLPVMLDVAEVLVKSYGTIEFVIRPRPAKTSEIGFRLDDIADEIDGLLDPVRYELHFLSNSEIAERVRWATLCATEIKLIAVAVDRRPGDFTVDLVSRALEGAHQCFVGVVASMYAYLHGKALPAMQRPTHWQTPVDIVSR